MATALMIVKETPDTIYFRVPCGCTSSDHDSELTFSKDDNGYMEMNMEAKITAFQSYEYSAWANIKWKFNMICSVLFKGHIQSYGSFVLSSENLKAFEEAIKISRKKFNAL